MAQKFLQPINMTGLAIQNVKDPANPQDAATKAYADALVMGLKWKEPVRAATTGNITLSGTQSVDGVALAAGDRVLVKDQASPVNNGIYVVAAGAWTRATDMDQNSEVLGATVFVSEGTTNGNAQYKMTTDGPITIGTTGLVWVVIGGGTSYTPGDGIIFDGSTIRVDATRVGRKAAATIGDGTATTYNVVHGLGTTDVNVSIKEVATNQYVIADVTVVDATTVQISFAVAPTNGQFRAFVLG